MIRITRTLTFAVKTVTVQVKLLFIRCLSGENIVSVDADHAAALTHVGPPEVFIIFYTQLVFDEYFQVEPGPDITTPFPPGLSFACVAKLWSRAAHCASLTVALLLQPATLPRGL